MDSKRCDTCQFGDSCRCDGACGYYAPITDEAEQERLDAIQAEERIEYRAAWFDYIKEFMG